MPPIIKLADVCEYFKGDLKALRKGEEKYNSGNVLHINLMGYEICAIVQASMKDISYKVSVEIEQSGKIVSSKCECARGNWLCSHVGAVLVAAEKRSYSVTSLPQQWMKNPKKSRYQSTKFTDLFPEEKSTYTALTRPVQEEDTRSLFTVLEEQGNYCGMWWLLSIIISPMN